MAPNVANSGVLPGEGAPTAVDYQGRPVNQLKNKEDIENLTDVTKEFPREFFEVDPYQAWYAYFRAWAQTAFSVYLLIHSPTWALPFAWIAVGTCATGMFVIGHECAHGSFSNNELLNEIAGTAIMAPLGWSYNSWRFTHNHHHAHTNNLDQDHLWKPLPRSIQSKPLPVRLILYLFYAGPMFWEASILHHMMNMVPFVFPKRKRAMVWRSVIIGVGVFGATMYGLYQHGGVGSIVKYWVMPYLAFNFWLSFYTYFHHRSPEITWKAPENWNKARAQLFDTAHVNYPAIIDWLHFDIAWHVPHHVSVKIPWYRLRQATFHLIRRYPQIHTYDMSWSFFWETVNSCHVQEGHDEQWERLDLSVAGTSKAVKTE
eukprot:Clim_evm3s182 gene=Clim_evmTU3s182